MLRDFLQPIHGILSSDAPLARLFGNRPGKSSHEGTSRQRWKFLAVPIVSGFILFRIFQNTLIFLLAAFYYQKLGLNTYVTLIGLSLLACGPQQ